jgi:hypothetical protein
MPPIPIDRRRLLVGHDDHVCEGRYGHKMLTRFVDLAVATLEFLAATAPA